MGFHPSDVLALSIGSIIRNWKGIDFSFVPKQVCHLNWRPPPEGFVKYFDGSAFGNLGPTGMGGLICNSKGDVMLSLSETVGYGSINMADMEAMRIGPQEA